MVTDDLYALSRRTEALINVLGRPTARRFPLTYSKILLAILAQRDDDEPITAFELMRDLRVDYDDVAAVVKIAKRNHWVKPTPDTRDRRRKLLVLSAKGRELAHKIAAIAAGGTNE